MSAAARLPISTLRNRLGARPVCGAFAAGLVFAMFSLAVSGLTLLLLFLVLPAHHWGPSAAAGSIGTLSEAALLFIAVLFIPIVETLIGQALPMELVRRLGGGAVAGVIVSAAVFGGGHGLNGGVAHGISSLSAGLVFACSYLFPRPFGILPALVAAGTTHATHNFMLLFVVAKIFPQWA